MKITKSKLKQLIQEEFEDVMQERVNIPDDISNDLMRMLNHAKALSAAQKAVTQKLNKAGLWDRQAAKLAGDVYAAQRAIQEYLEQ